MSTKRPVAEIDDSSASSKMARARLANPAFTLGRRCNASNSSRCCEVTETENRSEKSAIGTSMSQITKRQPSRNSGF